MASNRQLLRAIAFYRPLSRCRTLHSAASHRLQPPLVNRIYQNHRNPCASLVLHEGAKFYNFVPALMAGILGIRMLDVANADSEEANHKAPLPPELSSVANADSEKANPKAPLPPELSSTPSKNTLQDIARRERLRVEDMLRKKGGDYSSYPRFTVAVKGQKVSIKFQIPPACEIPLLTANLVSRLGCKDDDGGSGTSMELRAWDSGVAWQLTLTRQLKPNEADVKLVTESNSNTEDLCIVLFRPLVGSDKAEIEFMKSGSLTEDELDAVVAAIQLGGQRKTAEGTQRGSQANKASSIKTTVNNLESMGVRIYGLDEANVDTPRSEILWENIAGYTEQKREIEDTILLALQSPQVYDDIARKTRCKFETNRPRAVLFEGPPGTGKTSSARVIAKQAGIPLLYVPLEIIMSKYYGESERLLGKVFSLANDLPNGAIIFLDEIDSFATSRDGETHEATRRVLSVLLRQIDGFEQEKKVVVVAATNRKSDLDPALISRFDSMITFGLPDHQTRQEIAAQYAKHLTKSELREFANLTEDMSGRDIKDVCQQAERHWASKIIRGEATKSEDEVLVPPLQEYVDSAVDRKRAILSAGGGNENPNPFRKKPQFDFV